MIPMRKSIILLSVLIIILTISLIGASLAAFFASVNISTQKVVDQAKALYLAEAGLSFATNILRSKADRNIRSKDTIGPINLGEGTYTVEIDINQSLITSTGNVEGTRKTVQLQYRAL